MPYTMMLDAGHGGRDPGAVYQGRQEKDDTLRLTLAVGEILQDNEIDVMYTRTTDVFLAPIQRAQLANEAGVDFFVSIHRNSFPTDNTVLGVESLVYDKSGIKYKMAENINAELETIGFVNLGVQARPNLIVLRRTQMPAVLVEAGFINSDSDNLLFDRNFAEIAQAIAGGILDTLEYGNMNTNRTANLNSDWNMNRSANLDSNRNMNNNIDNNANTSANLDSNWNANRNTNVSSNNNTATTTTNNTNRNTNNRNTNNRNTDNRNTDNRNTDNRNTDNRNTTANRMEEHFFGPIYRVQTGAFRNEVYANRLRDELIEMDFPARIEDSGGFFRVMVGSFGTLDEASAMEQRLKRAGYQTVIVT